MVKPLKGAILASNTGVFDTITTNTIEIANLNIVGLFEDGIILNAEIKDSEISNTVIGVNGANVGYFTVLQTTSYVNMLSNIIGASASWDPFTGQFYISSTSGSFRVDGCSYLGNLEICRNDILATNFNGDINLIPNNVGNIYLRGGVDVTSTVGNFFVNVQNGNIRLLSKNNIELYSSSGTSTITTSDKQTFTTLNGDIQLNVDTTTTGVLTNVRFTSGNIILTTPLINHLNVGDVILVTNGSLNGAYTIGNILSDFQFSLTSTTENILIQPGGNFYKVRNNNIELNSFNLIKVPENTKLTLGDTTNSISGNTSGIFINVSSDDIIQIPQSSKLQFGTSGNNYINFNGNSLNINSSTDTNINGNLTSINTTNTRLYDPILTLADYNLVSNDFKDRGIEFKYFDTASDSNKLGWFGYKNSTGKFTFITSATNNNEVISGSLGGLELSSLQISNGHIDMQCGNILNVGLLTGCSNTLNIAGSTNVNISSSNRISLQAGVDITVPNNIPINFGISGNRLLGTDSNMIVSGNVNVQILTGSFGSVIIPNQSTLSFDGTSRGTQSISNDITNSLVIKSNNNINLTTTAGNVIVPVNTPIQYGNSSQYITGSTSGLQLITNSSNSSLNLIANSNVNVTSSFGNVEVSSRVGDVILFPSSGNVRIPTQRNLVFAISGTTNSLSVTSSGSFEVKGNSTNNYVISNFNDINLNGVSTNIPTNSRLNIGNTKEQYLFTNTSGQTFISNDSSSGSITIATNATNITSATTTISGNLTQINTNNTTITDPIPSIGDYTLVSSDGKDRGIQYRYYSGSMKLGWFGTKNNTNRFTVYSEAINTNEVITGTVGDMEISGLYVQKNVSFSSSGTLDMSCGTIANVNTITGCNGVLNLRGDISVNVTASSINLSANQNVTLPFNVPIQFGDSKNSISSDTSGNLTIDAGKVILNSDVQINGTTTNVYSTVTNIQDPILSIGGVVGPVINDAKDRGIEFKWNNNITTKVGFFGYKDSLGRFVFIKDGVNNSEVFSGNYGDFQAGDIYASDINLNNGNITGINNLSGGKITILTTSGNIELTPSAGNSIIIPNNTPLAFGDTNTSISSNSLGSLILNSNTSVQLPDNKPINFGTSGHTYILASSGNLNIVNSSGNLNLTPSGNVDLPTNTFLNFGSTSNSIYSDGSQLFLNGFNGVSLNSSTVNISGNINVAGNINATALDVDLNKFILPLGTQQFLNITSITSNTTPGTATVILNQTSGFLSIGDRVTLKNITTSPPLNGTYTVTTVNSLNSINISTGISLITGSNDTSQLLIANLSTYQGKDVGIQVNYWSTTGNSSITAGSAGYKTGFFGFKTSAERWSFYANATNSNDIITGNLGDIEVNKVFASRLSGFVLDGAVSAGSNNISGTNFTINGGEINTTPIGNVTPASGRFSTLTNTVEALFNTVRLDNSLAYTFERFEVRADLPSSYFRNPSTSSAISLFRVTGSFFNTGCGTMGSTSIPDGTFKTIVCSGMGEGSTYTLHFGVGKIITPNPLNVNATPSKLVFKRRSQSVQMIFDAIQESWVLLTSGVYVI